ncbi:hypothetical protein WA026_011858 [Henosepilachna vigintioctopunctata]|uniref:Uncharacterized protein n=1 Tax=Henosepilachna vigintioctopunctata TaxID=420089 RepID=A0AAW1UHN5_9CUCU
MSLSNYYHKYEDNSGFTEVRSKKKTFKQEASIGEGDGGNNKYFFQGKPKIPEEKKTWLFLSNARDSVDASTIQKYIQKRTEGQLSVISIKELSTRNQSQNNKCFLVGVENHDKDSVYETKF